MADMRTGLVVGVGASQGLGAAAARRFARKGLHVVIAGKTQGKFDRVVKEIQVFGGVARAVAGEASVSGLLAAKWLDVLLSIEAIADPYWQMHQLQRSAWTPKLELRPWSERL